MANVASAKINMLCAQSREHNPVLHTDVPGVFVDPGRVLLRFLLT
jgi:hypothetical protein